jgi:hypothetical protein
MTHPASCRDPEHCDLSYRDHLVGFGLSAKAIPSRAVHRTPGQPDEPAIKTHNREKRWERDIPAYKRLHAEGLRPRRMEGSAFRERTGDTEYDVTQRPVAIDYNDPR